MGKIGLPILVLLLLVGPLALAVTVGYLVVIGIEGVVDVSELEEIVVKLDIDTPTGLKKFENIATISVEPEAIRFRVVEKHVEGNVSIVLNGLAILRGENTTYRIPLPCLLAHGEGCVRVLMLIPGYDVPLPVEPGTYSVDLELSWTASGRGRFLVKLAIERHRAPTERPEIKVIGVEPENTTGWITARGSTRSYTLMVESNRVKAGDDGIGVVKAYAWMFTWEREQVHGVYFNFKLVDIATGQVVTELTTEPYRTSMYYKVLVEVKAPPGEYVLRLEIVKPGKAITLEIPLEIHR